MDEWLINFARNFLDSRKYVFALLCLPGIYLVEYELLHVHCVPGAMLPEELATGVISEHGTCNIFVESCTPASSGLPGSSAYK